MSTLLIVGYILVGLILWPQAYRFIYRYDRRQWPSLDWDDRSRAFALGMSAYFSAFWIVFVPGGLVAWAAWHGLKALARAGFFRRLERE